MVVCLLKLCYCIQYWLCIHRPQELANKLVVSLQSPALVGKPVSEFDSIPELFGEWHFIQLLRIQRAQLFTQVLERMTIPFKLGLTHFMIAIGMLIFV